MIRFIIKRKTLDRGSGCEHETFETFDVDVPDLQAALLGGGMDPHGAYNVHHLVGVEVLPAKDQA